MATMVVCLGLLAACKEPNAPAPAAAEPAAAAPVAAASAPAPATAAPAAQTTAPGPAVDLLANPQPSQLCNIEFIDGKSFGADASPTNGRFVVRGWLGDASGSPPASATLVLSREGADSKTLLPISLNTSRPDVVAYYPDNKGLANSGFETAVDVSSQAPGQFHLYLAYAIGAQGYVCDNGRRVQLVKP